MPIDGQRFLLTYSDVADPAFTTAGLADFLWTFSPSYVESGKEYHQNGTPHYHVYIEFRDRFRSNSVAAFDFLGRHPNIKGVTRGIRSITKVREYVRKEGGEFEVRGVAPPLGQAERHTWYSVLHESPNFDEFMSACQSHFTKDFILRHDDLERFAQGFYNKPSTYVNPYEQDSWIVPQRALSWVNDVFAEVSRRHVSTHLEPPRRRSAFFI